LFFKNCHCFHSNGLVPESVGLSFFFSFVRLNGALSDIATLPNRLSQSDACHVTPSLNFAKAFTVSRGLWAH